MASGNARNLAQRPALAKSDKYLSLMQIYVQFERDLGVEEKLALRQEVYDTLGVGITAVRTPDQSRYLEHMTYAEDNVAGDDNLTYAEDAK